MRMNEVLFNPLDTGMRKNPPYPTEPLVFPVQPHVGRVVFLDPRRVMPMPGQPRTEIGDLAGLADNIWQDGQKTPIAVFPIVHPDFDTELSSGHRRRAACILNGCMVRAEIRPVPENKAEQYDDAFIANFCREDLSLLDTVQSIEQLIANGRPWQDIVRMAGGKTKSWFDQYVILINMDPAVRPLMKEQNTGQQDETGRKLRRKTALPISIWTHIAKMPKTEQLSYAERMIDGGVSIEDARYIVRKDLTDRGHILRQPSSSELFGALERGTARMERLFIQYLEMPRKDLDRILASREASDRNDLAATMRAMAFHLEGLAEVIGQVKVSVGVAEKSPTSLSLEDLHPWLQGWVRQQSVLLQQSGKTIEEWFEDQPEGSVFRERSQRE